MSCNHWRFRCGCGDARDAVDYRDLGTPSFQFGYGGKEGCPDWSVRSGESVGDAVRLAFEVANIGGIFGNVCELVGVSRRLRFRLFVKSRYQGLVVRVERKGAPLHHMPEMSNRAECGEKLSIEWGPVLLILLQFG